MRREKLVRFETRSPDGTFGRFLGFATIEDDDRHNAPNVSCIPTGLYVCRRTMYHRGGYETFEVTGVPDRSRILFHIANTEEDVAGCIGLGLYLGTLERLDEDTGVRHWKLAAKYSREAFEAFMDEFDGIDAWELEVVAWTP